MGANVSNQTSEQMSSIINSVINESITNISREQTNITENVQNISFSIIAKGDVKNVSINQNAKASIYILSSMSDKIASSFDTEIQNKLTNSITQALKQQNKGINFGQVNASNQQQVIKQYIQNNIKNIIKTSISSKVSNISKTKQGMNINIVARNVSDITISQNMLVDAISKQAADTIVNNTVKNKATNEASASGSQSVSQINAGITLFGGLILLLIIGGVGLGGSKMLKSKMSSFSFDGHKSKKPYGIILLFMLIMSGISYFYYSRSLMLPFKIAIGFTSLFFLIFIIMMFKR